MLEHGGALRAAAARYRIPLSDWLDLSTGIHPQGWPVPPVPATAWQRLPEREDGLEAAATAYYGTSHLLPVAGSQAAIQALPLLREPGQTPSLQVGEGRGGGGNRLQRVGLLHPSYAEHAYAWRRAGHVVETLTVAELETAVDRLDVLVLVHPNNPTGLRFASATLLNWRERLALRGGWLVVDEAFMDATPDDSLIGHVGEPGLIILRSLGKFFGLAGARVGFVLAEPAVRERLQDALGPWTVSGPARWVATQALRDRRWQAEARNELPHSGERLAELLKRQRLPVAGGTALFQWVPLPEAEFWQDALARRGILVRRFVDPPGLRFGLPDNEPAWRRLEGALTGIRAERLAHPS